MAQTKLRSLKISVDDLLELVKRAAARGEVTCEGLSPSVSVFRKDGNADGNFAHTGRSSFLDGFFLTVEAEDELPTESEGGRHFLPVLDVRLRTGEGGARDE